MTTWPLIASLAVIGCFGLLLWGTDCIARHLLRRAAIFRRLAMVIQHNVQHSRAPLASPDMRNGVGTGGDGHVADSFSSVFVGSGPSA